MTKAWILTGALGLFAVGVFAYPQELATLAAVQLYDLWEMLAALLLFSIGFAVTAALILILLLLDRGLYRVLAFIALYRAGGAAALPRWDAGWAPRKTKYPKSCQLIRSMQHPLNRLIRRYFSSQRIDKAVLDQNLNTGAFRSQPTPQDLASLTPLNWESSMSSGMSALLGQNGQLALLYGFRLLR